jgi:hypothetical protein
MSQITRTQQLTDIENASSLSVADGKIDASEFKTIARNQADSSQFITPVGSMPAFNYDCSFRTWQEKNINANSTLTVSNPKPGEFYILIKTGAFTLTLPSGFHPISGNVVPSGRYKIVFGYDGTNFHFDFSQQIIV